MNGKEFRGPLLIAVMGIAPWTIVVCFWLVKAWTADSFNSWTQVVTVGVGSILILAVISIPPGWVYGERLVVTLRCGVILALSVSVIRVWSDHSDRLTLLSFAIGIGILVVIVRFVTQSTGTAVVDLRHPVPATLFANQAGRFGNHHKSVIAQRWAADLSALGPGGRRASTIVATRAEQCVIFDLAVYAPCNGVVVDCADGRSDNIDLTTSPRYSDGRGNFISIATDDVTVLMAHLRRGSVAVNTGDQVTAGQVVARVGNSGRTSEPHLHLHCEIDGRGVPFTIDGQKLFRGVRLNQR
ncbi:hypothetical protein GOEFS_094_00240 [Gordonia effusa NBRC 100432]|uniref:M23ase beta-sheet core domain-containing protein n=1 Tax=Gordonia effusa NBRC 100432 TaxID=1077974 RepID=H0R3S4_9ACTN|nr:M23 family metallopeptidase [Gordonia effusa]GAB19725.1 hypothetical protein GOEFS_094_00240 [Gordonia effusa NBRC 100432]